jgi:hypothetical protein
VLGATVETETTVSQLHCQLHQTQRVYSFKATSSAFGCNRQSLRSRSDIVNNLQSLKVESGRGLQSDQCEIQFGIDFML